MVVGCSCGAMTIILKSVHENEIGCCLLMGLYIDSGHNLCEDGKAIGAFEPPFTRTHTNSPRKSRMKYGCYTVQISRGSQKLAVCFMDF